MSLDPSYLRVPRAGAGQRIALFGGSFNPPHRGHRHVALAGLKRLGVDKVWWMVTPGNPLKANNNLAPLAQRIHLTERYADHPRMVVTAFEATIGTRYTADAIAYLKRRFPAVKFVWLMGGDNLAQLHHWLKWRDIMWQVPVAVVDRPGASPSVLAKPAAGMFADARIPEAEARRLADKKPPAWVFLHGPLDPTSSTLLRSKAAF
ncbi:nicotinate-nucleotide adenylyltransferase [Acuticoccus sp. M5D2P5]|uniref:nicotinate-nucleotide adenylyltransferase n=1 Tax=Acuticoccus kalidii TaxID=2910977 RepID=UPI001F1A9D85|nr:nicotinate-nucleotide adenylyltransferase [Acuticoccus kalidii]MCF3935443.1 nicotinate-nucleotide adenylyltransferase [Acuticoccus kalidii]